MTLAERITPAPGDAYVGTVISLAGEHLRLYRGNDGDALILGTRTCLRFGPGGASVLREFLDRCAMPGQEPAGDCEPVDGEGSDAD